MATYRSKSDPELVQRVVLVKLIEEGFERDSDERRLLLAKLSARPSPMTSASTSCEDRP